MFVALDLPDDARRQLAGWRDDLIAGRRDLRPVAAEALHVTLVFLGWQDESAAEAISRAAFGAGEAVGAPSLRPHVTPSDSALAYAAEFDRHYTVGTRARALGWSPTLHSVGTNVPRLLEEFRRAQERAA